MPSPKPTHARPRVRGRFAAPLTAILLLAAGNVRANTYCAKSAADLYADLAAVSTGGAANGSDNTIHIAAGTLVTTGARFDYADTSGHALTIDGGWDNTCANQNPNVGATVLDGAGANQVLGIETNGSAVVSHLTFQNGVHLGSSDGGGVRVVLNTIGVGDPIPSITFSENVVRNNATDYSVGGMEVYAIATSPSTPVGVADIENCLFTGNSAPTVGALSVDLGTGSTAYLINNTFTNNTSTEPGASATAIGGAGGVVMAYLSNSISYGNPSDYDFYLAQYDSVRVNNNEYVAIKGTPAAGSGGNLVNVNPQFVSATDFHLQPTSLLLRAGTLTPTGGLPATDLEGHPRSAAGKVDLGAYENVDEIFASGFEAPP